MRIRVGKAAAALLSTLALWGCGGGEAPPPAAPPPRPNVVVVLVDALRAQSLGLYGYDRKTAPHVAAFARGGYVFDHAYAQAPCTFPSVNSILTSRPPLEFVGQPDGRLGIPDGIPTLPEILRAHGYSTAAISASPIVRRTPSGFNPHGGFGRGFERFNEACLWNRATCVNQRVRRMLPHLPEPFFLYLHYMDVHGPYRPPETWPRKFAVDPYRGTTEGVATGDPNPIEALLSGGTDPDSIPRAAVEHLRDLYDEEIAFFDAHFQVLLDELRRRGRLDRTLFVFLADHGEQFLEHGEVKHCHSVFDVETRVPLIVRLPRELEKLPPRRIESPVANLDVLPTILDYLRIEPPAGLEGKSLRPAIDDRTAVHGAVFSSWGGQRAARGERYKLILQLGNGSRQLFDLASDPGETRDVLDEHRKIAHRLARELSHWLRDVEGKTKRGADIRDSEALDRLRSLGYIQ